MDLSKLKIEKYKNIKGFNFPESMDLKLKSADENIEIVIYYIDAISDEANFVEQVKKMALVKDNRVIMVYKKSRQDGVNRDGILLPFKSKMYDNFKIRRPALCALAKELSTFVQSYEG